MPDSVQAGPADQPSRERITIGSPAHKDLFCRLLLDTFDPYRPAVIPWPPLDDAARARLAALPFWQVALETETNAGLRMQALADATDDPLIREAVALNAFEERRHKEVLGHMIRFYGVEVGAERPPEAMRDPVWAFLRTGYGECFDSFFAFGLFELGRRADFLPGALVEVFEPVIQEEARHNLFFVNWVAWTRANRAAPLRPAFAARCLAAMAVQAMKRVGSAREVDGSNFTRTGGTAFGASLAPRDFLALCLAEQERRMARYDPRLLRPRLLPALARAALRLMPRRASAAPP
jgi:hypothetical protein